METIHSVEGSFGSEFPAIGNHCGVMAAWSRKTLKSCEKVLLFWQTTPYAKIFKVLFRKYTLRHRSTLCSNVVRFVRREIGEIARYSVDRTETKFRLPLKLSLLRGSRPKSDRASPECTQSAPDFIHIDHFRRSYSRSREDRQIAP